jgi:type I restriction enzyme S subunit
LIRWPLKRSSDLFELKYGKALVETARQPGTVPVYGTNGQTGTHDTPLFDGPGVVLGRKGMGNLGVEWVNEPFWVIDTAYALSPRVEVNLKFAYYLIRHVGLNHLKHGTSNPSLTREAFGAQLFPIPPLVDQHRIAAVLGTLDDKIESNVNLAANLEHMASRVFLARFGALIEGPVPLAEIVTVTAGRSYKSSELVDQSDVALLSLKSIAAGGGYQLGGLKPYSGAYKAAQVIAPGDVVVAVTDLTQAANVVGRAARVPPQKDFSTLVVSLDVVAIRAPTPAWGSYLMGLFQSRPWLQQAIGYSNGSTVLHLNKQAFAEFFVRQPMEHEVSELAGICDPLHANADALRIEAGTLGSIRDALLPKLLSGQIRVPSSDDSAERLGAVVEAHELQAAQAR